MNEEQTVLLLQKLQSILEETSDVTTITITQKAADKFKEICAAEGKPLIAIRFDERPAGCSGFEYDLDFSTGATENDAVFHGFGVDIHVDKRVLPHLIGCEIDFVDGLHSGFKISNPNVSSSCGCGSSHGY
jgi:iron-sulfur cluster assembly accessory protein